MLAPGDDPSFAARPGLVVIDGGKGQLGAAIAGMRSAGVEDVPVVSLAKKREEVFRPGRPEPLLLDEGSSALRVLQHIRDEAHRFALRHHRGKRDRGMTQSVLDALPGVGPARKGAILRHFGSIERFLSASREELEAVPGVPSKVARDVYDRLHKTAGPREGAAPVAGGVATAGEDLWS
jgi:excinuclease ABC subunit C